jgi:phosphoribosyl 1,2-cyclic phosphodiesterase
VRIRFWGTRGSIPTPGLGTVRYGGNTACVEVRAANGALLVLDAGTGLRELGVQLAQNGHGTPVDLDLFISHLHWDHIQGIPFFRPAYDPRTALRIHAPHHSKPLKDLLGLGMDDPFFPVGLDAVPAKLEIDELAEDGERRSGPFRVRTTRLFHPAPAYAYRIEADGGALVYATDTEDPFSGKENPVVAFAQGADVLIHDAQYVNGDYKKGWGHSTAETAVDVALAAGVKKLVLYHHDPERTDDALDKIAADTKRLAKEKGGPEVFVAYEGMEIEL